MPDDEHWTVLRTAPDAAGQIVARLQAAFAAADRGDGPIHTTRRRDDAAAAAREELNKLARACREARHYLDVRLQSEISQRRWVGENDAYDHRETDEDLREHLVEGRWPPLRRRLEEHREPDAVVSVAEQIIRELERSADTNGLLVLRHEMPRYLERGRRWPATRIASVMHALDNAESRLLGGPPPEVQAETIEQLREAADRAVSDARGEVARLRAGVG